VPPTLVDIARETNTSVSTVSRVLAGGVIANRISKETRERVQLAATRLGYRPNLVARTLRTRRSNTIALLVSDIANPFYAQIASLIEQRLHQHGYSLMLCNSGENPTREVEYLQLLNQKAIDGLILVPITIDKDHLMQQVPAKLPLVILDRPIPGIDATVSCDQVESARLLCDTLQTAGVRNVGIVSGPLHVMTHKNRWEAAKQCFNLVAQHEGAATAETGRDAVAKLLPHKPNAIICTNNTLARGLIDALVQIENPPVIGIFDEVPMMHVIPIPIVCAVQDINALAEGCVIQLLPLLRGEPKPSLPMILPGHTATNRAFEARRLARPQQTTGGGLDHSQTESMNA
jgi:DNA-binding LacI/PurR family transcriptional regulator